MNETDKIDLLLECFEWDMSAESRFHALLILRRARKEETPSWDDFLAGRVTIMSSTN